LARLELQDKEIDTDEFNITALLKMKSGKEVRTCSKYFPSMPPGIPPGILPVPPSPDLEAMTSTL
jgi:hypothetical protein